MKQTTNCNFDTFCMDETKMYGCSCCFRKQTAQCINGIIIIQPVGFRGFQSDRTHTTRLIDSFGPQTIRILALPNRAAHTHTCEVKHKMRSVFFKVLCPFITERRPSSRYLACMCAPSTCRESQGTSFSLDWNVLAVFFIMPMTIKLKTSYSHELVPKSNLATSATCHMSYLIYEPRHSLHVFLCVFR